MSFVTRGIKHKDRAETSSDSNVDAMTAKIAAEVSVTAGIPLPTDTAVLHSSARTPYTANAGYE